MIINLSNSLTSHFQNTKRLTMPSQTDLNMTINRTRFSSHHLFTISFLSLLILTSSLAHASPSIQHWTTSNGARVYFVPATQLPMVDVRITFDAGSARDASMSGIARLTSLSLDDGASNEAGELSADQLAEHFDSLGAQFNTSAHRDMAVVTLRSLSDVELLEPAVETAALILRQPTFTTESLDRNRNQMQVALRTRQQSPGDLASDAFFSAVYKGHPYASPSHGTQDSLAALTRKNIIDFHQRYYVAKNAVVVIVGALDRDAAAALAEKFIGKLPAGSAAKALPKPAPLNAAQTIVVKHPSTQTHILIGQPGMSRDDSDYFPLYVGNHVLGGSGLVSRISEEIREKRGLAYSAYSYFSPMRVAGPFMIGMQTRNDQVDEALSVINETINHFRDSGPDKNELNSSQKNITGGFPLRLSSNKKIADYLSVIAFYQLPLDYLDSFSDKVSNVTRKDITAAFQKRLQPQNMVTVLVGGKQ